MRVSTDSAHLPRCSEGVLDVLDSIAWAPADEHADAAWLAEETGRAEVDVHRICRVASEALLAQSERVAGYRSARWVLTPRGALALDTMGAKHGLWSPAALRILRSTDGTLAVPVEQLSDLRFLAEHLRALRGRGVLALSRPLNGEPVHIVGTYAESVRWALESRAPRTGRTVSERADRGVRRAQARAQGLA